MNNFSPENLKKEIESLIDNIKNKDTSKEDRLNSLKILNAILEYNIEFIKEVKKEIKK
jgi:hypothetical protein